MMGTLRFNCLVLFSLLCVVSIQCMNTVNIDLNYDKSGNPYIFKLITDVVFDNNQFLKADCNISQSEKTISSSLSVKGRNLGKVNGVYEISNTGLIMFKANVSSSVGVNGLAKVEVERLNNHKYTIKYQLPNSLENHVTIQNISNQLLISHQVGDQSNVIAMKIGKSENNYVVLASGKIGNEKLKGKLLVHDEHLALMDGKLEVEGSIPWSIKVNTERFPFHIDISPASKTGVPIINDNSKDMSDVLFIEADYQPDNYLYFISNYQYLKGFKIDRMNQDWVRLEWNNTEFLQADISSSPYSFITPCGNEGTVDLKSMKLSDLLTRKVKTSLDLVIKNVMPWSLEWDVTNPLDKIKVLIKSNV